MQDICKTCCMDISAKEIVFTETGCNFCDAAKKSLEEVRRLPIKNVTEIQNTKGAYNVLVGLSGGVDSSYALHKAVELGLRPLCFTLDNGWNDPVADENILKLVESLKVPLYRYVIDLKQFRALQSAFMRAGLKNIEIPTDHVLMAASYELAAKYGIKTIISGGNVATESIMPASWGYNARDLTHILDVWRRYGDGTKLSGLPLCSVWKWNWYRWVKKIKTFYLLDYLHYDRDKAIETLGELYGYKNPGPKHEENVFTRWFQNFYLFEKWGIDKRKAHLSSMVVSGEITRQEALQRLTEDPVYPELGIEQRALRYPKKEHEEFRQDKWYGRVASLVKLCKKKS